MIEPPSDFRDARSIPRKYDTTDPRADSFHEHHVVVDLRNLEFVRPAAILWCTVFPLLARIRNSTCKVLVPLNFGVCIYLKSVGLFKLLRDEGVELDDRDIPETKSLQVILPVTRFDSETGAEHLANRAMETLKSSNIGASNIYPVVSETFGELAINVVQHSESPIGGYGLIQFYAFKGRHHFVCCVADGGIGICKSLEKNPMYRNIFSYDWDALDLAIQERVTGTGSSHRGIGLFGIAEDMRKADRLFVIHSGLGVLSASSKPQEKAKRQALFPGTLAYVSIPT